MPFPVVYGQHFGRRGSFGGGKNFKYAGELSSKIGRYRFPK
jgi:hypothetical protein